MAGTCVFSVVAGVKGMEMTNLLVINQDLVAAVWVDDVAMFFMILVSALWMIAGIHAFKYLSHEGSEPRFFAFYLLSESSMLGVCVAGNLATTYLFYEFLTLCSMPLVLHSLEKSAIMAALKYLFYSIAGAFLTLYGVFVLAGYTQPYFTPGGSLDLLAAAGKEPLLHMATFLCVLGFGTKAGLYPLHGWLPTAHPVAPAPASAVLSAVITKAGVIGILRCIYYTVGPDFLRGTWVQNAWIGLALFTVFMGSMMAYFQKNFKKRLAFSTVSQVSYVLTGLFFMTELSVSGALLQVLFHAAVKTALFLSAGTVIFYTHKTTVDALDGMGKILPLTMVGYTIASISLIGIPPTGGFFSKWFLATGALAADLGGNLGVIACAVLLISALLTAGYLLPISVSSFFKPSMEQIGHIKESPELWVPVMGLALMSLLSGIFYPELIHSFAGIARNMLNLV